MVRRRQGTVRITTIVTSNEKCTKAVVQLIRVNVKIRKKSMAQLTVVKFGLFSSESTIVQNGNPNNAQDRFGSNIGCQRTKPGQIMAVAASKKAHSLFPNNCRMETKTTNESKTKMKVTFTRQELLAALLFACAPLPVYYDRYFIHESLLAAATFGLIVAGWRAC